MAVPRDYYLYTTSTPARRGALYRAFAAATVGAPAMTRTAAVRMTMYHYHGHTGSWKADGRTDGRTDGRN